MLIIPAQSFAHSGPCNPNCTPGIFLTIIWVLVTFQHAHHIPPPKEAFCIHHFPPQLQISIALWSMSCTSLQCHLYFHLGIISSGRLIATMVGALPSIYFYPQFKLRAFHYRLPWKGSPIQYPGRRLSPSLHERIWWQDAQDFIPSNILFQYSSNIL